MVQPAGAGPEENGRRNQGQDQSGDHPQPEQAPEAGGGLRERRNLLAEQVKEAFIEIESQTDYEMLTQPGLREIVTSYWKVQIDMLKASMNPDNAAQIQEETIAHLTELQEKVDSIDPRWQPLDDLSDNELASYMDASRRLRGIEKSSMEMMQHLATLGDLNELIDSHFSGKDYVFLELARQSGAQVFTSKEEALQRYGQLKPMIDLDQQISGVDSWSKLQEIEDRSYETRTPRIRQLEIAIELADAEGTFDGLETLEERVEAARDLERRSHLAVFPTEDEFRAYCETREARSEQMLQELDEVFDNGGPILKQLGAAMTPEHTKLLTAALKPFAAITLERHIQEIYHSDSPEQ
jgi:hypothetical protein